MTFTAVAPEDIGMVWPAVAPILVKAVDRNNGEYTIDDVRDYLESGDYHLWVFIEDNVFKGACVTYFAQFPRIKTCNFLLAAGFEIDKWACIVNHIIPWAKDNGCAIIYVSGRAGWERVLKPFGFEKDSVTLQKQIS